MPEVYSVKEKYEDPFVYGGKERTTLSGIQTNNSGMRELQKDILNQQKLVPNSQNPNRYVENIVKDKTNVNLGK